ncbi:MAG: TetR/AcrR family transcriptional regulator [Chloroflexota bacterium]
MPKLVTDQAVFEAVIGAVVKNGYTGATTKIIAEAAEVNEATLFRKYGSKEQLVIKAINYLHKQAGIESLVYYSGDVRADLMRLLQRFFEGADANEHVFMAMISEIPRHPELIGAIQGPNQTMMKVGRLLARYQAEGVLKPEHPLQAVMSLIGPIVMGRMLGIANPNLPLPSVDLEAHIENYLTGRKL